jgi:putative nucleotidyltransferase with HDIG domain
LSPINPPTADEVRARLGRFSARCASDPLLAAVAARGGEVHLVGGSVRDLLLDVPSHDHDFTMPSGAVSFARQVADRCGGSLVVLKAERGMARVVLGADYADFADYQAGSLDEDLAARDLTLNAMALPLDGGALRDPTGGLDDLCAGRLRCARPEVLDADPLRLLRVVRFASTLGFAVAPETRAAMPARAPLLARVAGERIRDELMRILASDRAFDGVFMLDESRALGVILPELEPLRGLAQGGFHHLDVFAHTMAALRALDEIAIPAALAMLGSKEAASLDRALDRPRLRLAALLHDIGKPATRGRRANGTLSFERHEVVGAEMVPAIAKRLKLSAAERAAISCVVRWHLEPLHIKAPGNLRPRHIRRYYARVRPVPLETLLMALADSAASCGPSNTAEARAALHERVGRMLAWFFSDAPARCRPLIDGDEIMAVAGIAPGPRVKALRERLMDAQADGRVSTEEEARAWIAQAARHSPS